MWRCLDNFGAEYPEEQYRHKGSFMTDAKLIQSEVKRVNEAAVVKECKIDQRGDINRVDTPRGDGPNDALGEKTGQIASPSRSHPSHILREKLAETTLITYRRFHSGFRTILIANFPSMIDVPSRNEGIIIGI